MAKKYLQNEDWLIFLLCFVAGSVLAQRDPTTPLVPSEKMLAEKKAELAKLEDLDLTSIFISEDIRIAIINGQMLKEGEILEGFTVKEIKKDKVIVERDEELVELKVFENSVRLNKE